MLERETQGSNRELQIHSKDPQALFCPRRLRLGPHPDLELADPKPYSPNRSLVTLKKQPPVAMATLSHMVFSEGHYLVVPERFGAHFFEQLALTQQASRRERLASARALQIQGAVDAKPFHCRGRPPSPYTVGLVAEKDGHAHRHMMQYGPVRATQVAQTEQRTDLQVIPALPRASLLSTLASHMDHYRGHRKHCPGKRCSQKGEWHKLRAKWDIYWAHSPRIPPGLKLELRNFDFYIQCNASSSKPSENSAGGRLQWHE